MIKPNAIILDLDSTLFNVQHRHHLALMEDWDGFHNAMSGDSLNVWVRSITNNLSVVYGAKILIVTTRPEAYKFQTKQQLDKFNVMHHGIFMRREGDKRTSPIVKSEIIEALKENYEIMFALEDRDDVIDVYNRAGIFTFKPMGAINK